VRFGVGGLGFRVFGFQVSSFGYWDSGFGIRDSGFGFRVLGFHIWGFEFGVSKLGVGGCLDEGVEARNRREEVVDRVLVARQRVPAGVPRS